MAVRRVRALLLDAMGTVIRLQPPGPGLRTELERRFGIVVSTEQADAAMAGEIDYYRAHLDEGRDEPSLAALRLRCAEVVRGALPRSEELLAIGSEALTGALLAALRFELFDDVIPVLESVRAGGARVVIVSNWDISLHEVTRQLGLAPILDGTVTSAEAGARKPAPAIFEQALALAGVTADQAVHVGDDITEDVAGARNAGIEPLLLCRDGRAAGPAGVRTITTLLEVA
jgi:putative hydrolase of the HAD superfamily